MIDEVRQDIIETLKEFPSLKLLSDDKELIIEGEWLVFGEISLLEILEIRIIVPNEYPEQAPKVWEISNKFHKSPDTHFNVSEGMDGSACLFLMAERYEKLPIGTTFKTFLNGPVKEFFFSQVYFKETGIWPFGEWPHGAEGVYKYYANKFETQNIKLIYKLLEYLTIKQSRRNFMCPCGKNKKYRKCHHPLVKKINFIPSKQLEIDKEILYRTFLST